MHQIKKYVLMVFLSLLLGFYSLGQSSLTECIKSTYGSYIGVREATGNNDGFHVELFLERAGLSKDSHAPWCAAFVNNVFYECGIDLNLKYPAYVPSYVRSDWVIYKKGSVDYKRQVMETDLFTIWFASKKRPAHIGFIDEIKEDCYITVEGNTNEAGSREGDGVYRKIRLKSQVYSISNPIK